MADFFTKPLQGSLFCKFCAFILNLPADPVSQLQEHVESSRWGMMMSSVSRQMVIDQPHWIKEATWQATLMWHVEDAVQNKECNSISSLVWINKSKVTFYRSYHSTTETVWL